MTIELFVDVPRTNYSMFFKNWSPIILYFSESSFIVLCMCSSLYVENSEGLKGESFLASKSKSFNITASSILLTMSSIMPEDLATFFLMSLNAFIAFLQFSMKSLIPKLERFFDSWPCSMTLLSFWIWFYNNFFSIGFKECTASLYSLSMVLSLSM